MMGLDFESREMASDVGNAHVEEEYSQKTNVFYSFIRSFIHFQTLLNNSKNAYPPPSSCFYNYYLKSIIHLLTNLARSSTFVFFKHIY